MNQVDHSTSAATDVGEFIADLDGGVLVPVMQGSYSKTE